MRTAPTLLLLVASLAALGQDPLKGLKKVKPDLRPVVGAYYRYTPPGADWYYYKTSIPGPPEQRNEMFFRRDTRSDSLCLTEEVSISEYWVDKDHFRSDSTFHLWATENIVFKMTEEYTLPKITVTPELRYGAPMGYRMHMRTGRLLNGLAYETQTVCYVFKSPRACMLPSLPTGFVAQCRVVLIYYSREDRAGTVPDISHETRIFDLFSLGGSNPF